MKILRVASLFCAVILVVLVFQAHNVSASCSTAGDFNHALASCGSVATASGSSGSNGPGNAIDGVSSTYWQSSSTTGWLAVQFQTLAYVNIVKAHFTTTKYSSLSVYLDTNGNGVYESSEKLWSTTSNAVLDVVANLPNVYYALGVKITIDLKNGNNNPEINEFEAFLQGDSDGDGLTNTQESATTYYQDMSPGALPATIPDDGVNVSSNAVTLAQFYGIANGALANFTVDHSRKTDLTAQVGYWNATAWIDRYVWDPGRRLDSVSLTQPLGNAYVTGAVSVVATVLHPEITSKVEFRVAGQLQATVNASVGNEYRWTWNTAAVPEGPTKINATQYDTAGGKAWSEITVNLDQPPAMTWVAPADGALVSGVVNVRVTAADLQGVEWVEFYVDNLYKSRVTTPNDGSSGYLWPWDTSQYCTNGGHTLKAVATENGPLYLTKAMAVTVTTNQGLRVCITSPANGAYVHNTVVITADAATPQGTTLTKVDFYIASSYWSTDTTAPYASNAWDTTATSDGAYTLTAIATNSAGNTASSSITIHVSNGGGGGGCRTPPCPTNPTPAPPDGPSAPAGATLGVLTTEWNRGEVDAGTNHAVVVDLVNPQTTASSSENASRILRPGFPLAYFTKYLQWRLVIRDWTTGIAGNVSVFTLRFEVKLDPNNPDTDGDGIPDGTEVNKWHTLPVTRDSDLDGLTDDYEIAPHALTISVNGVTQILTPFTTDPTKADTDGDGLTDGQERGFVSFGMTKVVGEVGVVHNVGWGWTTVYMHNHYTTPVVFAEPPTFHKNAFQHVRIRSVTDHSFQLRIENWTTGGSGGGEDVVYLALESGDHILSDGSVLEAGSASVTVSPVSVNFREPFTTMPLVIVQTQTLNDANPVIAKRTSSISASGFGVYLNANSSTTHNTESVAYVAITPQASPNALASWTRAEAYVSATTGTWTYPAAFAKAPLVLAWMQGEASSGNKNIGLRLSTVTNTSATVYREQSGTAPADTIEFFSFAAPMNVTARMATNPTVADTDGDKLPDGTEVTTYGSNPTLKDTDADGIPDNVEATPRTMTIPVNGILKTITFTTSPTSPDTDADGIPDLQEIQGVLDHRVLYYDMATLSSGTVVRDLSGNGADGNLKYIQMSSTGKVGGSILFNGTTSGSTNRVQVPSTPWLNVTDGFTIMAWVDPTTTSQATGATVVGKGYGNSASFVVDIVPSGNNKVFRAYVDNTNYKVVSSTTISSGTWYLITVAYDQIRGTLTLYVNANAPAAVSNVPAMATNTHDLSVGSREWSTSSGYNMSFKGYIDEVQMWDRPLSRSEVNASYNLTSGSSNAARLDMETLTSSGALFDSGGAAHPATLTGTTVVEGRVGLARSLAGTNDGIILSNPSTLWINSSVSVDVYVQVTSPPASDASVIAQKGTFYLNISSDGLVRWSIYKVASIASPLPIPLGRWLRITATATASSLVLYLDGVQVASWSGSSTFPKTTNALTLGYAEGQAHLPIQLDEVSVLRSAVTPATIADWSPHGIQLNPNSTDTDGDGLSDGQELYTFTVKTPVRYPIPDSGSTTTDFLAISLGAPSCTVSKALAMVGITHPDMGQVSDSLYFRSGAKSLQSFNLKLSGTNAGQTNNFTSFDLFQLGLGRSSLAASLANAYAVAWDNSVGRKGQVEYLQLQFTVHLLPNRADTDRDGLNDTEEVNPGTDGYITNPWKADTDGDGIPDGVEAHGWSWSGSTIVNNTGGFHTDPTLNDTDRDGTPDGRDMNPLVDVFARLIIGWATIAGSDPYNSDGVARPFVQATIQGNTTYTNWYLGPSVSWGHDLTVNIPDDIDTNLVITVQLWDYDSSGGDVHHQIPIGTSYSQGSCQNLYTRSFGGFIGRTNPIWFQASGGCGSFYANPLNVSVQRYVPARTLTRLFLPADYSGIYNLTDSQGRIVSRRYVGEPRFVALLLNVTWSWDIMPPEQWVFLVPRSVFFDTLLYKKLNTSNENDALSALTFRQNLTTASSNADDLREILTGNVTPAQWAGDPDSIVNLLLQNATGAGAHVYLDFTMDYVNTDTGFLYSLPTGVVRMIGYQPVPLSASIQYRFCTSSCGQPTDKPWWEQVWDGLLIVAAVLSAVILPINAFLYLAQVLLQVGNWFAQQISGAVAAVKSAARWVQNEFGQAVDWIKNQVISLIENSLRPALMAAQALWQMTFGGLISDLTAAVGSSDVVQRNDAVVSAANRILALLTTFLLIDVALRAAEIAADAASLGIAYVISKVVTDSVVKSIVATIASVALLITTLAVFSEVAESVGWVSKAAAESADAADKGADIAGKVGDVALGLLALLFVKKQGDNSLFKQWNGFGLSLIGLVLALASLTVDKGLPLAFLDFSSLGLAFLGVAFYFINSRKPPNEAADAASTYATALEKIVVFASVPVAAAKTGADALTGGFSA